MPYLTITISSPFGNWYEPLFFRRRSPKSRSEKIPPWSRARLWWDCVAIDAHSRFVWRGAFASHRRTFPIRAEGKKCDLAFHAWRGQSHGKLRSQADADEIWREDHCGDALRRCAGS